MLNKNGLAQRVAGVIDYSNIEITRVGANGKIIVAIVSSRALGRRVLTVAPLVDIGNAHTAHRRPTRIEHLAQDIFAWAKAIMRNP